MCKILICRLLSRWNRRLFLCSKKFFGFFSEKRRFWVCILPPFVQISERTNPNFKSEPFTCPLKIEYTGRWDFNSDDFSHLSRYAKTLCFQRTSENSCYEYWIAPDKDENAVTLLPHFSCHSLRHTFTTRMCEAGVNVKVIQDTLGHKDIATTLNIYTDVTKELKRSEFEGLDLYFKNK